MNEDPTRADAPALPTAPGRSPASESNCPRPVPGPRPSRPDWRALIGAYVSLTKPRIVELLLITTIPAMLVAARMEYDALPSLTAVLATVIGGALAAGSANAINCYIDRDIDQLMPAPRAARSPSTRSRRATP